MGIIVAALRGCPCSPLRGVYGRMTDYDKLAQGLRRLVATLSGELTPDERACVLHFVDVDEYGLAMEDLLDILGKKGVALPRATYEHLAEVARAMGMEEQTVPFRPDN
jgi:hypothetical protein